ncbi:hypothetical protein M9435_006479 [Picochlorum sp. BPE23]|nr:hypothetical protein M9435_006479 [Picochlorum sp. BPE23]
MVRPVLVDASCQQYADERMLKRAPAEVGILIGRRTSSKDFVLQFIATPEEEEGHGAVRVVGGRSGKSSSSLEFDTEWISEHACQLGRILPGGLCVLGVYVFCESGAFQSSQSALAGLLAQIENTMILGKKDMVNLIVHVDAGRGVLSAKEKDGAGSMLKPCDLKNSSLLTEMVEIQCLYPLNVRVDICSDKSLLCDLINELVTYEVEQRVSKAVPLFHGQIPESQESMIHDMKREGFDHIPLEFLIPISRYGIPAVGVKKAHKRELSGTYYSKGQFTLTGNMECRAYVFNREKVDDTISAIKEDIESSLRSRLEVLIEAAEMATEAMEQQQPRTSSKDSKSSDVSRKHPLLDTIGHVGAYEPQFPQRAFLKWKIGACTYCDYIVQGDGVSEALHRVRELVGPGRVDARTFHCSENIIESIGASGKGVSNKKPARGVLERLLSSCNIMLSGTAMIVAILAILASLLLV